MWKEEIFFYMSLVICHVVDFIWQRNPMLSHSFVLEQQILFLSLKKICLLKIHYQNFKLEKF